MFLLLIGKWRTLPPGEIGCVCGIQSTGSSSAMNWPFMAMERFDRQDRASPLLDMDHFPENRALWLYALAFNFLIASV